MIFDSFVGEIGYTPEIDQSICIHGGTGSTVEQAQVKNLFEFLDSGIVSSNDFAKRVVKSGLISREDVEQTWAELAKPLRTPSGLANELASRFRLLPSQAVVLVESADLPLVLGNYVIEGKLGQGGMGTVYHAVHRKMKREVALKVISLKGESLIRRFDREVELISRLSHPNIVAAFDAGDSQGVHYLVMERVYGIDLGSLVEANGPVPLAKALDLVRQAARGLAYAHAQGIVHRDVKPSNLLLDNQGIVKVLDLGIARLDGANDDLSSVYGMTQTGTMMGTVDYMSPEQAMDAKSANAQSDIYSLGCTLFFLATGKPMYDGDTVMKRIFAHREEPIPRLSMYLSDSNANLTAIDDVQRIFEQMVAKLPTARFAGMIDVVGVLDRILDTKESTNPLPLSPKTTVHATSDTTEVPVATTDTEFPKGNPSDRHIGERVVSKCPTCSASIAIQSEWIGKIARCNKCNGRIYIQATGTVVPVSAASAITQQTPGSVPLANQPPTDLRCLGCDAVLRIASNLRGKKIKCAACKMNLLVSEDGSHFIAVTTSDENPTHNKQSLESLADIGKKGSASINSAYVRPIRVRATEKPSRSKSRQIAIAAVMATVLGIGLWIRMGGNNVPRIASTGSTTPKPSAIEPSADEVRITEDTAVLLDPSARGFLPSTSYTPPMNDATQDVSVTKSEDIADLLEPSAGDFSPSTSSIPPIFHDEAQDTLPTIIAKIARKTGDGRGADTTVKNGGGKGEQLGGDPSVVVQTRNDIDIQHAYLRFDFGDDKKEFKNVGKARLVVAFPAGQAPERGSRLRIYGVPEEVDDNWQEKGPQSMVWKNSLSSLGLDKVPLLAEVLIEDVSNILDGVIQVEDPRLTEFVQGIGEDFITLLLAGGSPDNKPLHIVSREGGAGQAPVLELELFVVEKINDRNVN